MNKMTGRQRKLRISFFRETIIGKFASEIHFNLFDDQKPGWKRTVSSVKWTSRSRIVRFPDGLKIRVNDLLERASYIGELTVHYGKWELVFL